MPLIEVKALDRRFEDQAQVDRLIAGLTDAMCEVYGEDVRPETWVIIGGISPKRWGFGGATRS